MKLYIVRHGETDWNKKRLIQGKTDIPLNENGIYVAKLTAQGYEKENLQFTKVYSSPLQRALKTAEILAEKTLSPEKKIILDDRLKEFDFGQLEGQTLLQVDENNPDGSVLYTCFYQPEIYEPVLGGESYYDMVDRAKDFIRTEIMDKEWKADDKVLLVCHGGVIRGFICALLNTAVADFWETKHKNLSTNIFIYDSEKKEFTLEALSKYYYDTEAHAINGFR